MSASIFSKPTPQTYLDAAKAAADWLGSLAIDTAEGKTWPKQTAESEDQLAAMGPLSFYGGTTGIVYFFLQIGRFLQDERYLSLAADGARFVRATWLKSAEPPSLFGIPNSGWGLFQGGSGVAFVLHEVGKQARLPELTEFSKEITQQLAASALEDAAGHYWSGQGGVLCDSGVILYLLYAAKEFQRPDYLQRAVSAGKRLVAHGRKQDGRGTAFIGLDPALFGLPPGAEYPNFEFGTAGIAYTLARLFEESGLEDFLQAAEDGAAYLRSIAAQSGDAALIPYRLPDLADVFYLGYCHGPAGTGRLFHLLHRLTHRDIHKQWAAKLANGIVQTGAPEHHSSGYWNVVSQCCGASAMLHFFLGLWASERNPEYLQAAEQAANHILHEGVHGEAGLCWYQAFTRVEPWRVSADTGYSNGTAGIGAALLEFYQAATGNYDVYRFVDDPFPKRA